MTPTEQEQKDIQQNKDVAAASWTLVLAPLILYFRKDSKFVQFHARQSTILFIIAVLIALLPWSLNKLNVLTVLVAVAGFINANNGVFWRVPIIADWADKGVEPVKIIYWIRDFFLKIFDVLKRIFIAGQKKISKKENSNDQVSFLESEIIKERYLQGKKISTLSADKKAALEQIKTLFTENNFTANEEEKTITFENANKKAILGNLSEKSALIFINFNTDKIKTDISYNAWQGFTIDFDNTSENQIEKIENIILK